MSDLSPAPLLLSPEEVAERLRIGRTRVYAFIHRGELPSVKIGRSRRIRADALPEFIDRLVAAEEETKADDDDASHHYRGIAPAAVVG